MRMGNAKTKAQAKLRCKRLRKLGKHQGAYYKKAKGKMGTYYQIYSYKKK